MEVILEFIGKFFVQILGESIIGKILGKVFGALFYGMWWMGVVSLKWIAFSKSSIEELKIKYKDSSKPYFMGFGILMALFFMIFGVN